MKIKELKKGEFFRLVTKKGVGAKTYVRDEYDRSDKKYCAYDFFDVCAFRYFKPSQEVTTDFEF